ncbi:uncharacterized protein PITG_03749 [Phytophthora infestans T30-4]|uniref:Uncharacterized protein n=1 Tax=Phytophthora infestans (strain T30-4) TaxID=403677 RepID=D0MYE8_PHYIT|nr:uncharacterized protein PITG_03749 [Phytophthora infestans T30-4]EEY66196.1 hypothetical protein PITG_03749 [Phytophthora infestans T30-4]|eukprot:XP_002906795.1 hypothetical protein PITG_03749 [Phytophthora infestans T30-4]
MAVRNRDGDSAGRLVRVLGDCDLVHMEAAIACLGSLKGGVRIESLMKPGDDDDVDVLERSTEVFLSLSDHKQIARLQAALATIVNAYDVHVHSQENNSSRKLVRMVAGAAVTQSMRDCTASRTNFCIWGSQAERAHVLLEWMVSHEHGSDDRALSSHDYVRQLLLEWIQPSVEKQKQLAGCLTLFELLQRRRIIRVGDSHRVKPSKLALIALETLILLYAVD